MAEQVLIQLKLPEQTITRTEAKKAFYELRKQAADVPEMSLDEINVEIMTVRRKEKDRQHEEAIRIDLDAVSQYGVEVSPQLAEGWQYQVLAKI